MPLGCSPNMPGKVLSQDLSMGCFLCLDRGQLFSPFQSWLQHHILVRPSYLISLPHFISFSKPSSPLNTY